MRGAATWVARRVWGWQMFYINGAGRFEGYCSWGEPDQPPAESLWERAVWGGLKEESFHLLYMVHYHVLYTSSSHLDTCTPIPQT